MLLPLCACGIVEKAKTEKAKSAKETEEKEERIIVPVEAQKPHRGPVSSYFETTTRVEAERRVNVNSEGTGRCLTVHADEGDKVNKGDLLAELDKTDIQTQLQQTEVKVRQTKVDLDRSKEMLASGLIASVEYDNARFAYESALASLDVQRVQLNNLSIQAPISGVVTKRIAQVGMLVSAGAPVFEIVDPSSYILNINPPEKELPRLQLDQKAKVTVDSIAGEEFAASVTRINPSVDATSGTVKVRLEMDAATKAKMRESAFARVRLLMETHKDALLIPKDAVIEENARYHVFIVADEKSVESTDEAQATSAQDDALAETAAEPSTSAAPDTPQPLAENMKYARRVEVEVGLSDSDFTEILSGLDDQSLVITLGQKSLKQDTEIKVTTSKEELQAFSTISTEDALGAAKEKQEELKKISEEERRAANSEMMNRTAH